MNDATRWRDRRGAGDCPGRSRSRLPAATGRRQLPGVVERLPAGQRTAAHGVPAACGPRAVPSRRRSHCRRDRNRGWRGCWGARARPRPAPPARTGRVKSGLKDGLSLPPPTLEIARLAVLPNRRHVSGDRTPASNLPGVVGGSAAHVVAAIPLEPPAWILLVDPPVAAPDAERLRGVHAGSSFGAGHAARRTAWRGRTSCVETLPGSPSCTSRRRRRAAASLSASDWREPGAKFRPTGSYASRRSRAESDR